jgi:hypothetical protein
MAQLPKLGTTTGQAARKPKGVPFQDLYNMASGQSGFPLDVPLSPLNPLLANEGVVTPGMPVTTGVNTFLQMPDTNSFNRAPPVVPGGGVPLTGMLQGSQGGIALGENTDYIDRVDPEQNKGPMTLEELAAQFGVKLPPGLTLEDLPRALPGITIPRPPSRDVPGEGRARAQQAQLSAWLPLLSLLATGSAKTGIKAMPSAYAAIAGGSEKFQDKAAEAEKENYGAGLDATLRQRALDNDVRNQEVGIVENRNQQRVAQRREELQTTLSLLGMKLSQDKVDNAEKKYLGDQRIKFLSALARLDLSGQEAYWQSNKAMADQLGLKPMRRDNGSLVKLSLNSDLVGFANAKTRADALKASYSFADMKQNQVYAKIRQDYAGLRNAKEIAAAHDRTSLAVANIRKESAWDLMVGNESGEMARFYDNLEFKKWTFKAKTHHDMNSPTGIKINQLFDRAAGLRVHQRQLMEQITGIRESDKLSTSEKKKEIALYEAQLTAMQPLLDKAEQAVSGFHSQAATGYVSDGFVDSLNEYLDPASTAGDAGAGARKRNPVERIPGDSYGPTGYQKPRESNGGPRNYESGFTPPVYAPPKRPTGPGPKPKSDPGKTSGRDRPSVPIVPRARTTTPPKDTGKGKWIEETDPATGKKFRYRKKN